MYCLREREREGGGYDTYIDHYAMILASLSSLIHLRIKQIAYYMLTVVTHQPICYARVKFQLFFSIRRISLLCR